MNRILLELRKKPEISGTVKKAISLAKEKSENALATHRSNVNEYLLAHELAKLAGHKDTRPGSSEEEKQKNKNVHDRSKAMISSEEYNHQAQRAKHMASASMQYYKKAHGIDLKKAVSFHITAGGGGIKKVTGLDIKSEDNTADVVAHVPGKKGATSMWPGISAKSNKENTEGKGTERISNRGITDSAKDIGANFHDTVYQECDSFAKRKKISHLPLSSKSETGGRKEWLRKTGNEKHEADSRKEGTKLQVFARDSYMQKLNGLGSNKKNIVGVDKVKKHLLNHHFRENSESHSAAPYIVASGYGSKQGEYGAHVHSSSESPHIEAIRNATHFSFTHSGETGMNVYAHTPENPKGVHVLKTQMKWNSQPMVSAMKNVGTEGTLKEKK
jgi:hypothetical protein